MTPHPLMNWRMATHTLGQMALADADSGDEPDLPELTIAQVYEAHFQYVWRCLRGLGVRDDLIADAVHDVFLVVQRKLGTFDGKVRLTTWLYAIALRVSRRYRARAATEAVKLVAPPLESDETRAEHPAALLTRDDAESQLERGQRLDLARRALAGLAEEKREAFVLACVEQLSAVEIAQITGLPVNTVYSRIRAARRAFGAQLTRLQSTRRS